MKSLIDQFSANDTMLRELMAHIKVIEDSNLTNLQHLPARRVSLCPCIKFVHLSHQPIHPSH